jgi:hypothetical protein
VDSIRIRTEDGYTFLILPDGSVSDNADPARADMSWTSLEDFLRTMAEEGISLRILGPGFQFYASSSEPSEPRPTSIVEDFLAWPNAPTKPPILNGRRRRSR